MGLSQQRLAHIAGVSRRHLAALEKGANVSVAVLYRIASALNLTQVSIGEVTLESRPRGTGSRTGSAYRAITRAQELLSDAARIVEAAGPEDVVADRPAADSGREVDVPVLTEFRPGRPLVPKQMQTVRMPAAAIRPGQFVVRLRGRPLKAEKIEDGDLLVVEPRVTGSVSANELVIAIVGGVLRIQRWSEEGSLSGPGEADQDLVVVGVVRRVIPAPRRDNSRSSS